MRQLVRRLGPDGPRRRVVADRLAAARQIAPGIACEVVVEPDVAGNARWPSRSTASARSRSPASIRARPSRSKLDRAVGRVRSCESASPSSAVGMRRRVGELQGVAQAVARLVGVDRPRRRRSAGASRPGPSADRAASRAQSSRRRGRRATAAPAGAGRVWPPAPPASAPRGRSPRPGTPRDRPRRWPSRPGRRPGRCGCPTSLSASSRSRSAAVGAPA